MQRTYELLYTDLFAIFHSLWLNFLLDREIIFYNDALSWKFQRSCDMHRAVGRTFVWVMIEWRDYDSLPWRFPSMRRLGKPCGRGESSTSSHPENVKVIKLNGHCEGEKVRIREKLLLWRHEKLLHDEHSRRLFLDTILSAEQRLNDPWVACGICNLSLVDTTTQKYNKRLMILSSFRIELTGTFSSCPLQIFLTNE